MLSSLYTTLCALTPLPQFVHHAYASLYNNFGGAMHPTLFVAGLTFAHHMLFFWITNLPFIFLDVTKSPKWFYKYKIQKTAYPLSALINCAKVALFNQFFLLLPLTFLMHPAYSWRGCEMTPTTLPSGFEIFIDLIISILVYEVLFYYSHRLLHTPTFYRRVHSMHHKFKAPVGMAAIYAHPIEFIFSNGLPLAMGVLVAKSHLVSAFVWYTIAVVNTIQHHSGYKFPWQIDRLSPSFHDYHHYSFHSNFGLLGWLDSFHQTDKGYAEYMAAQKSKKITLESETKSPSSADTEYAE